MPTVWADVSYYQNAVDDSYPHRWLAIRACDGTFIDPKFAANHAWAHQAAKAGKLTGYTVYCVYRPGVDVLGVLKGLMPAPDKYLTVMVDVEAWYDSNGHPQITGDHSAEITALCQGIATWLGSRDRVLAYGNQGDLAAIFPRRPGWLRLVVAAYGTQRPNVANMVAWQYTDGSDNWASPTGLPKASPPFGNCDHNVALDYYPVQLAALLGVGDAPAPTPDTPTPTPGKKRHPWVRAARLAQRLARLRDRLRRLRDRLRRRGR